MKTKIHIHWTPELDSVIQERRNQGKTFQEIGQELGTTKTAIGKRFYYLRYPEKRKEDNAKKEYRPKYSNEAYRRNKKRIRQVQETYRERNKELLAAKDREYYQKNRTERLEASKQYYRRDPEAARQRNRKHYLNITKEQRQEGWYQRKYGISVEDVRARFKAQGEQCAICGTTDMKQERQLHLDHNHTTGQLRGVLCSKCNRGLGHFNDCEELLQKAILYLDVWAKKAL